MATKRQTVNSGTRGAVAAMAMTGARSLTTSLGLVGQTPPEAVLRQRAPGLLARLPRERQPAAVELAHWTFGAAAGAAFALLPAPLRAHGWAGPAYGLVVLTGFEAGVAPALGLSQSRRMRVAERLVFLADHMLYGLILAPPRHERP